MDERKKFHINVVNIIWGFDDKTHQVKMLLIQNKWAPYENKWGLPQTALKADESAEEASLRLIREKIGIDLPHFYTEQLATFSNVHRSVSGRTIALTYMTYLPSLPELTPGYGAKKAEWFSIDYSKNHFILNGDKLTFKTLSDKVTRQEFYRDLPKYQAKSGLISDHSLIMRIAFRRITNRLNYLPTILLILGDDFTLKQAREVYALFTKTSVAKIDNSNFRKTHAQLFTEIGFEHSPKSGRPAKLYKLKQVLDPRKD